MNHGGVQVADVADDNGRLPFDLGERKGKFCARQADGTRRASGWKGTVNNAPNPRCCIFSAVRIEFRDEGDHLFTVLGQPRRIRVDAET